MRRRWRPIRIGFSRSSGPRLEVPARCNRCWRCGRYWRSAAAHWCRPSSSRSPMPIRRSTRRTRSRTRARPVSSSWWCESSSIPLGCWRSADRRYNRRARVPGAAQRLVRGVVRGRPGIVTVCGGPGSAVHRFAQECVTLHRVRDTREKGGAPVSLDPRERLIVALDVASVAEAEALVARLGETVSFYKIGYQLAFAGGIDFARVLAGAGKRIFLDLKLHDIGNTVARGVESVAA